MSEFLAEARILVRPDTTKFRAELEAALALATAKPITVPVVPVVAGGLNAITAETTEFTSAQVGAAAATQAVAAEMEIETINATKLTAATTGLSASTKNATKGAFAQTAALFGLRGGTLAASSAFIGGTVAVLAFAKAVQSAASLQTELNVFRVTAGATADEMTRISEAAKQLGRDITLPGVTANDAAVALTELSKAGLSVQDSLDGARGALQLATAAQIDNVTATKLVAGALNAFQLAGTESVRVADLLAGAAKESQGEISDMGTALSQVAAVSQQFGVTISDTVTLLTELAQAGLSGGRAGTSLRVAFLRLVNPTAAAAKELDKLGIAVRDANGNLRPGVFTDISDALQQYTKAQRDAALATIFGSDAIRAAAIIGNKGALSFLTLSAAVNEAGLAQEQAAARTSGLQGELENVSNQFSALGLTIGQAAIPPLSAFLDVVGDVLKDVNTVADGIVVLTKDFGSLGKEMADTIPFADAIDSRLGSIVKNFLKFGTLPVQALGGVSFAIKKLGFDTEAATEATNKYGDAIDEVTVSVGALGVQLLQSAADSRINTQQVTSNIAALQQSAADSRIDFSKLGQQDAAQPEGLRTKQIENIIGGFNAEEVRAKIKGDNAALLNVLNTEQDFLERQLQRDFVQRRPALKRAIEQALLGTVTDIATIQKQAQTEAERIRADAKRAADAAARAVAQREQALLSQFGLARDQRQNAIAAAAATKTLTDDISQQKKLKALVLQQIAAVKERISVEGGRAAAVTALKAILITVNKSLTDLATQQQAAALARRQQLVESATLDVDLAQITGNRVAEINARQRVIVQLRKEQALVKKGTNEYKTLRNEIAAQNAAIAELNKERNKQKNLFAQATFDFLQAQQGFASNLLGNLIPSGATGGLVGGSPVSNALTPAAGFADGQSKSGPTSGQAQTTNGILARILEQLKVLNGSQAAPEANRQAAWQRSTMDYHSG